MVVLVQPKITIITAVYNRVNTIEQTISSVVNQTYQNIEYIVIDGGSNDGTVDVIRKYEDKIAYWISEPDCGVFDAFNKGILAAKGEYIQFLGSDDSLCSPDTIENVVKYLNEEVDILSCCIYLVHESLCRQMLFSNSHAINKNDYKGGMIPHPGMFTRRTIFDIYHFDDKYKMLGDYKFFLQCYFDDSIKFSFIDLPVVYFSVAGITSVKNLTDEEMSICKDLGAFFPLNIYKDSYLKSIIKIILKKIGVFPTCKKLHWRLIFMKQNYRNQNIMPHCCNNKICRWCGRK